MRALLLTLCLFASSQAVAQEVPRAQCTEGSGFSLRFGEGVAERDVRRALRLYPDFGDIFVNDGDTARPVYRVTAIARYDAPQQATAMMHLLIAALMDSEQFAEQFSDGHIDDETLNNGIVFYSSDPESNEGIAMQIAQEHSSLLVTCTDLRGRAEALTGSTR